MTKIWKIALTSALVVGTASSVAADSAPVPVVRLAGRVSPSGRHLRPGTPVTFTLDTRLGSVPPGADFVLRRLTYLFPRDTVVNGRLFPACSAATLQRANGRLGACPKGSRIGSGSAAGTAVAIGVTSHAVVTLFNGPGGRSITINVSIVAPALINATFSAPFATLHRGPWANKLTIDMPASLQSVLDGDIVASRIDVTTGVTRVIGGVRRGYVEALRCPAGGRAPIHGDFAFTSGATASADTTVVC
jgi:hypothetical protein